METNNIKELMFKYITFKADGDEKAQNKKKAILVSIQELLKTKACEEDFSIYYSDCLLDYADDEDGIKLQDVIKTKESMDILLKEDFSNYDCRVKIASKFKLDKMPLLSLNPEYLLYGYRGKSNKYTPLKNEKIHKLIEYLEVDENHNEELGNLLYMILSYDQSRLSDEDKKAFSRDRNKLKNEIIKMLKENKILYSKFCEFLMNSSEHNIFSIIGDIVKKQNQRPTTVSNNQPAIENLKKDLSDLNQKIVSLNQRCEELTKANNELKSIKFDMERKMDSLYIDIQRYVERIKVLDEENYMLAYAHKQLKDEYIQKNEELKKDILYANDEVKKAQDENVNMELLCKDLKSDLELRKSEINLLQKSKNDAVEDSINKLVYRMLSDIGREIRNIDKFIKKSKEKPENINLLRLEKAFEKIIEGLKRSGITYYGNINEMAKFDSSIYETYDEYCEENEDVKVKEVGWKYKDKIILKGKVEK